MVFLCMVCSSFTLKLPFSLEESSCVMKLPENNICPAVIFILMYPAGAVTAGTSTSSSVPLLPPASPGKHSRTSEITLEMESISLPLHFLSFVEKEST